MLAAVAGGFLAVGCGKDARSSAGGETGAAGSGSAQSPGGSGGANAGAPGMSGGGGSSAGGSVGQSPTAGCQPPATTPGVWTEIVPPPGQSAFQVTDAYSPANDDLYFAGNVDVQGVMTSRILRWNQGCWTVELTFPGPGGGTPSVHGTGPNDLWAAAGAQIYHRDAQGWGPADSGWLALVQNQAHRISPSPELMRVRAAAPNDVWFAERESILHWDGHGWAAFDFADPNYPNQQQSIAYFFSGLLVDGPNDVWVVGGSDVVGTTYDPSFLHHFDGTTWTHLQVWVFGVNAIARAGGAIWMAVPQLTTTVNGEDANVTLVRYQPGAAAVEPVAIAGVPYMPTIAHSTQMTSLFARAANDVWAAGADVAHFDGQQWTLVPDAPEVTRTGNSDPGTYVTGDGHSVWLATAGRFFRMVE